MDYMELAENIKFLVAATDNRTTNHTAAPRVATPGSESVAEGAPGKAARVVLARRNAPDNRVWGNVDELAHELQTGWGMEVEVVTFGAIPFQEQVPFFPVIQRYLL